MKVEMSKLDATIEMNETHPKKSTLYTKQKQLPNWRDSNEKFKLYSKDIAALDK